MKKNLVTIILAAMVVAGCLFVESNEFVSLAFIGFAGAVCAWRDLLKDKPTVKSYTIDELVDLEMFGEYVEG